MQTVTIILASVVSPWTRLESRMRNCYIFVLFVQASAFEESYNENIHSWQTALFIHI